MSGAATLAERDDRAVPTLEAFLRELTARSVRYAVIRGAEGIESPTTPDLVRIPPSGVPTRPDRPLTLLVDPEHRGPVAVAARGCGGDSRPLQQADAHEIVIPDCGRLVYIVPEMLYGSKAAWLSTSEPEDRVLRRAVEVDGVSIAALSDRFVDALLHCLLDLRAFPDARRHEVRHMMARLRADPPAAGRACERVQMELAPALEWGQVLADVIGGRWHALLGRARRLEARLWRNAPLTSTLRLLAVRP